ncbi:hypothetical protein MHU86_12889 [Fragilaria crotonensis]|nr:hypothetical protein MHU86_12889 [Fragilaria crotonensis]
MLTLLQTAYFTADCRETIRTRAGPEFGSEAGTIFLVKMALDGLKSAGAAFCPLLAETLYDFGYVPTKADPDIWLHLAVKADGFKLYEIVLCCIDDVLSVSADPLATLQGLQSTFKLKDADKIEKPKMYLGAQLGKMQVNGHERWTMSPAIYVVASVKNVKAVLGKKGFCLPTKC